MKSCREYKQKNDCCFQNLTKEIIRCIYLFFVNRYYDLESKIYGGNTGILFKDVPLSEIEKVKNKY